MSPRTEFVATATLAGASLAADAVAVASGNGALAALALGPTLLVCTVLAVVGYVRAAHEATTRRSVVSADPVTGLADASQLRADIEGFLDDHTPGERRTLLILDLVGFKRYNDAFGFACGDALLRRLSRRLEDVMQHRGRAYRLRGAQFAVVAPGTKTAGLRAAASDAVLEVGEGFMVRGAHGSVLLPDEAESVSQALKLADQEIQAQRATLRSHGLDELSANGLRPATRISASPFDIVELAVAVAQHMGMTGHELDHLETAASLRDVGMIALPDELAHAAGPLSDEDEQFVRLHTLAGERLLRSNFRMDAVADVVRSSHEHWDGEGYPDGLVGEDIPLAARIVLVCSSFEDMISHHAQRPTMSTDEALRELARGRGTISHPAVVGALGAIYTARAGAVDPLGTPAA
jgi:diguanylate cyclase (GGDEF)-like protein